MAVNSLSWFLSRLGVEIWGLQHKHTAGFTGSQKQTHNLHWYLESGDGCKVGVCKNDTQHSSTVYTHTKHRHTDVCELIGKKRQLVCESKIYIKICSGCVLEGNPSVKQRIMASYIYMCVCVCFIEWERMDMCVLMQCAISVEFCADVAWGWKGDCLLS